MYNLLGQCLSQPVSASVRRSVHGGAGGGPMSRDVPALGVRSSEGHVRALLVRRLPWQQEQLPHAGGLPRHLQRRARYVPWLSRSPTWTKPSSKSRIPPHLSELNVLLVVCAFAVDSGRG